MQRQRGELVPIGEVISGLDDVLVPAIHEDVPQSKSNLSWSLVEKTMRRSSWDAPPFTRRDADGLRRRELPHP